MGSEMCIRDRGRPERRQQRPLSLREHTGRRRRRADTEIVRSRRATCVAKRAGDVFSPAAAFRTNRPTCVSTQFQLGFDSVRRSGRHTRTRSVGARKMVFQAGQIEACRPSERAKSRPNSQVRAKKWSQSATQPAERIFFSQSNAAGRTRERNAARRGAHAGGSVRGPV